MNDRTQLKCVVPGCQRMCHARHMCRTHYTRWYKHRNVNVVMKAGRKGYWEKKGPPLRTVTAQPDGGGVAQAHERISIIAKRQPMQ